jgi:hypothetical protein
MTVTPIRSLPCDADADDYTGASRPAERTQPLPEVKYTGTDVNTHVNEDTIVQARQYRTDPDCIVLVFSDPRTFNRTNIHLDHDGVIRLIHALQEIYPKAGAR